MINDDQGVLIYETEKVVEGIHDLVLSFPELPDGIDEFDKQDFYYSLDDGKTWLNNFDLFEETESGYKLGFEHQGGTNHFQLKYIVNHNPEPKFQLTEKMINDDQGVLIYETDKVVEGIHDLVLSFPELPEGIDEFYQHDFYYSLNGGITWSNDFDLFEETDSGYKLGFEHQGGTNHFQLKYIVNHISDFPFTLTENNVYADHGVLTYESDEVVKGIYDLVLSFPELPDGIDEFDQRDFYFSINNGETWSNNFNLFDERESGYKIGFEHLGGTNHFQLKYITDHESHPAPDFYQEFSYESHPNKEQADEYQPSNAVKWTFDEIPSESEPGMRWTFESERSYAEDVLVSFQFNDMSLMGLNKDHLYFSHDDGKAWSNAFPHLKVVNETQWQLEFDVILPKGHEQFLLKMMPDRYDLKVPVTPDFDMGLYNPQYIASVSAAPPHRDVYENEYKYADMDTILDHDNNPYHYSNNGWSDALTHSPANLIENGGFDDDGDNFAVKNVHTEIDKNNIDSSHKISEWSSEGKENPYLIEGQTNLMPDAPNNNRAVELVSDSEFSQVVDVSDLTKNGETTFTLNFNYANHFTDSNNEAGDYASGQFKVVVSGIKGSLSPPPLATCNPMFHGKMLRLTSLC